MLRNEPLSKTIWGMLPLPPGAFRYVFAKHGPKVTGTWVTSPESLRRFCENYASADCYIQLNPAIRAGLVRPMVSDVAGIQAILIDLDPIVPEAAPASAAVSVRARLDGMGVPNTPTHIDSGRGSQLWLILGHPCPPTLAGAVRRFIHTLATQVGTVHGCRVDTACADLARLARLPGTINQKTGRQAKILDMGAPMDAEWLSAWDSGVEEGTSSPVAPPPRAPRTRWPDIEPWLTRTAKEFICEGVTEPGRHKGCVAAARSLVEVFCDPAVAWGLLRGGAERCSPELPHDEVRRIYMEAFRCSRPLGPPGPQESK